MAYLHFTYEGKEIILTPDTIKDIRQQLQPQIKKMPLNEVVETVQALGLSSKMLVDFFTKKIDIKLK